MARTKNILDNNKNKTTMKAQQEALPENEALERFEKALGEYQGKKILYVTNNKVVLAKTAENVTVIAHSDYKPEMMYSHETTIFDY